MKIVALCKTFSGPDFVEAAIESLYSFVDAIVFVHSTRDWDGKEHNGNEVFPVVQAWAAVHDKQHKIHNLVGDWPAQKKQYDVGYDYIRSKLPCDWVMFFDTDEVWDYANLETAHGLLSKHVEVNAVAAYMHTYIKSPFYRVTPAEMCKPTVFIRPAFGRVNGIRGNQTRPRIIPEHLFFHHFTYVRRYERDVFRKVSTTLIGDREDVPNTQLVDIEKWRKEKWDKLPNATDFHTTAHFEKSWHAIRVVRPADLPASLRDKPILKEFNLP